MVAWCSHVRYSCGHILNVVHETVPNCSIILLEYDIAAKNSHRIVQRFDEQNINGFGAKPALNSIVSSSIANTGGLRCLSIFS